MLFYREFMRNSKKEIFSNFFSMKKTEFLEIRLRSRFFNIRIYTTAEKIQKKKKKKLL